MAIDEKEGPSADVADEAYELDLEENSPASIEEAFEDAVAAVDRADSEREHSRDDDAGSAAAASTVAPARRVAELEAESSDLRQRLQRTLADFDNFRKRTERERESQRRFALFDGLRDFLVVGDNLERAMMASGSAEDLKQGLSLVMRQLEDTLRRHGVTTVEAVGKPFDPAVHEAVARQESAEVTVPMVTAELQRGYYLHERLLRPAMVNVAMPVSRKPEAAAGAPESAGEAGGG